MKFSFFIQNNTLAPEIKRNGEEFLSRSHETSFRCSPKFRENRFDRLAIVEWMADTKNLLIALMSLACHKHGISRFGELNRTPNRPAAIGCSLV